MNAGRLVFPALRWKEESGFSHERGASERALGYGAGGFILFGGTPEGVGEETDRLVREAGRPLLFASDLERGAGQQVRGFSELPPPRALASLHDPAVLRGAGILTAVEALSVGINWVLAPVADLDCEPDNPIVQTRAFGEEPEAVAASVTAGIVGCEAAGAMACAKHFPGHGRTRSDSHLGLPVVDASAEALEADLLPFQAAVGAGVSSVMTAHVAYPALDPSRSPATFSKPILDLLRHRFGFNGLIVSDALMMEGAREGRSQGEIGLDALRAGVDLLLYPDEPGVVAATRLRSALKSCTGSPLNDLMTSPRFMPAPSAALPGATDETIAPPTSFRPRLSAMSDVTGCTVTPSCERRTRPLLFNWSMTFRAMFAGIANPMPMLPSPGEMIWELIPTSSPRVFTSAPPELP